MGRVFVIAVFLLAATGCGSGQPPRIERVASEVDVSNARDDQSEVSVAETPNGRTLLAGSNEYRAAAARVYDSVDGGRTWTSRVGPPLPHPEACAGDPAVAVDATGYQYYAFVEYKPCDERGRASLYVATRPEAGAVWVTRHRAIASRAGAEDDNRAIAVDRSRSSLHRGRVYIAWAQQTGRLSGVVVSHSDDHGLTWSTPVTVNDLGVNDYDASVAIGPHGETYVSWLDFYLGGMYVDVARDGVTFGTDHTAADIHGALGSHCGVTGFAIRAQGRRCVGPGGTLSVDTSAGSHNGRVYFTYSDVTANGGHDVFVDIFDDRLRPILGYAVHGRAHRVTQRENSYSRADQFLPVSAVDETTGDLWICFYDTAGDILRVTAHFSCVASVDGAATFSRPFRAASRASDESRPSANLSQYGDYEGLSAGDGVAHPIWTDTRDSARGDEIFTTTLRLASRR